MKKSTQTIIAFAFGVTFVLAILIIALAFPYPTRFQLFTFKVVLALAAGGVASMIPGFIEAQIPNAVRAGGALAVFVVVFFFNPAELAVEGQPTKLDGVFISKDKLEGGKVRYYWKQANLSFTTPSADWAISTKAAESGLGDITLEHQSGKDAQIQLHVSQLDGKYDGQWQEFRSNTTDLYKGTISQFGSFSSSDAFVGGESGFILRGFVKGEKEGLKKVDLLFVPLNANRLLEVHLTRNVERPDDADLLNAFNNLTSTVTFEPTNR